MTDSTNGSSRFSVGKTFGDAVEILSARWKAMIGTTILMVVAMLAAIALFAWPIVEASMTFDPYAGPDAAAGMMGMFFLGVLLAALIGVWLLVTLLKIALDRDTPQGIFASLAAALPRVPSAIGIYFLMVVGVIAIYIGILIVGLIVGLLAAAFGETALWLATVLIGIAAIATFIYVFLGWVVAYPATVAEKLGPIQSMARSWRLASGHRLRLIALWVLSVIAVAIVALIVMFISLPGFLGAMSGDPAAMSAEGPGTVSMVIFFVLNGLLNIGIQMFFACLYVSTYLNLAAAEPTVAAPSRPSTPEA